MATSLVVLIGVGVLATALRALGRVRRLVPDAAPLRSALESGDAARIRSALAALLSAPDADAVSAGVLGQASRPVAIVTVDEHLGDVGRELQEGATLSRTLPRIAFGAGLFGAVFDVALRGSAGPAAWIHPLESLVAGVVFAGASLEITRRVTAAEERARSRWDEVGRLLAARLEAGRASGPPT
ncbi:MAG TPA: hypothetical protein VHE30_26555 [Polyangiaceae bacterium]|nr:hypothetical protein [Polyangiaceae bacterium]